MHRADPAKSMLSRAGVDRSVTYSALVNEAIPSQVRAYAVSELLTCGGGRYCRIVGACHGGDSPWPARRDQRPAVRGRGPAPKVAWLKEELCWPR